MSNKYWPIDQIENPYIRKPATALIPPILFIVWLFLGLPRILRNELFRAWGSLYVTGSIKNDWRDIGRALQRCWNGPAAAPERWTGIHNGKTTRLVKLAEEKSAAGFKVIIILPAHAHVRDFKECHQPFDATLLTYKEAFFLRSLKLYQADYILLDDCDRMYQGNGDPVAMVESLFRHKDRQPVIIGAYSIEKGAE